MTSVNRSYASPSIQELLAENTPANKRKAMAKRDDEDGVTYRSISNMGEHSERH
jgi:hypothetical protein